MAVVQRIGFAYESTNCEGFQVHTSFIGRPNINTIVPVAKNHYHRNSCIPAKLDNYPIQKNSDPMEGVPNGQSTPSRERRGPSDP